MKISDLCNIKTLPILEKECRKSYTQKIGPDGWRIQHCCNLQPQSVCNNPPTFNYDLEFLELHNGSSADLSELFRQATITPVFGEFQQGNIHLTDAVFGYLRDNVELPIMRWTYESNAGLSDQNTNTLTAFLSRAKKLVLNFEPMPTGGDCRITQRTLIFGSDGSGNSWGLAITDAQDRLEYISSEKPESVQIMHF